jgi:hypothetical protein
MLPTSGICINLAGDEAIGSCRRGDERFLPSDFYWSREFVKHERQ